MIQYVLSIAFQLTGAVLLITNFWPSRKAIIKAIENNETDNMHWSEFSGGKTSVTYTKEELTKQACKNYQSLAAFLLISVGYILGIFGENTNRWKALVAVLVLTLVLWLGIKRLCRLIAQTEFKEDITVTENTKK